MPDFSKEGTYSPDESYTGVKFGADAPLLEVELNELQKIQSHKVATVVSSVLSNGFLAHPQMNYEEGILEVKPFKVVIDGNIIEVGESMMIEVKEGETVYLSAQEVIVNFEDDIYKYGNLSGGTKYEDNGIVDPRVGAETTKRIQMQVELTILNSIVGHTYLCIGEAKMDEDAERIVFVRDTPLAGFDPVIFKNAFEKESDIFDKAMSVSPQFVDLGNVVGKNYAEQAEKNNTMELLYWMGV